VQGYYDRDNAFYLEWDKTSRDPQKTQAWLQEWVYDISEHGEYIRKLGQQTLARLSPGPALAPTIDYGVYQ
jgi:glutaconate CoA-transferase subunit A